MPRLSKSDRAKTRVTHLLKRLLAYANHELEDHQVLEQTTMRWLDRQTAAPKLVVQTTLEDLATLIAPELPSDRLTEHLRHDLRLFKETLHILEDNRTRTQGSKNWHFTLKLWYSSTDQNLVALEQQWNRCIQTTATLPRPIEQLKPEPVKTCYRLPVRGYVDFIGRETQIAQLLGWLHPSHPVARIGITGIGGVGKTSLVLEIVYRCAAPGHIPHFDTIIFISAKQHHLTVRGILPHSQQDCTLRQVCRSILQTLGCSDRLTADLANQIYFIQTSFARQQVLLVVDNLETLEETPVVLAFLHDLPATVKVIVTSCERSIMDISIQLEPLSETEGLGFIQQQAQIKAIDLSAAEAHRLYQSTGGIPAAIVYAVGQLANGYLLSDVLPRLTLAQGDYCRFYFERSVKPLVGQPAHRLLMGLALFPKPVSREAIAQVAIPDADSSEGLARLHQLSLVTAQAGHYTMLPLTRGYALAELQANPDFEQQVRARWIDWYLNFCQQHGHQNWKEWHEYKVLDAEWENIQAAIEWCIEQERYDDFGQFWDYVKGYTHHYGYWTERLTWMHWWIQSAEERSDTATIAQAQRDRAWTLTLSGKPDHLVEAEQLLRQAWELRDPADWQFQLELTLEQGTLGLHQGQLETAHRWLQQARQLLPQVPFEATDRLRYAIRIDYYEAEVWCRQGQDAQAKLLYDQVLQNAQTAGWQQVEIYTSNWLAEIALRQTDLDRAETLLSQSLPIAQGQQDKRSIAFHNRTWAHLEQLKGNQLDFQQWSEAAIASFMELGMDTEAQEMQREVENAGQ